MGEQSSTPDAPPSRAAAKKKRQRQDQEAAMLRLAEAEDDMEKASATQIDESNEDADNKTDVKSGPGTPDHKDQKPEPVTVTRETVFYGGELANASQEERDAFEAEMLKLAEDTIRQIEETKK